MSERARVGRKTPGDGKLEVSAGLAETLLQRGAGIDVIMGDERSPGRLEAMPCSCGKGGPGHVHYFLQSEPFRTLAVGTELWITVSADAREARVGRSQPADD